MDTAVALVTTYLQMNGYFVQTEVPIVERVSKDPPRFEQITDIDVLAVRFPSFIHTPPPRERDQWAGIVSVDPALGAPHDEMDVIIGEVKEGPSRLNPNLTEPRVLRAALQHTGGCMPEQIETLVQQLVEEGEARTTHCHGGAQRLRLVAFGGTEPQRARSYRVISLGHIFAFLQETVESNRAVFKVVDTRNAALAMILLAAKLGLESV